MSGGFKQWNTTTGDVILDTQVDAINRTFGVIATGEEAGSLTDARFAAGEPYFFMAPNGAFSTAQPKSVTFSGNTMSWSTGPGVTIMYGVGAGVSSYNPATGNRPGFQCRNINTGAVTLDETMFALHLIGKGSLEVLGRGSSSTFDMDVPDGNLPAIALRTDGNGYVFVRGVSWTNPTTIRYALEGTTRSTVEYYVFGRIKPSMAGTIGARWWDTSTGALMGDTSVPMMRVVSANQNYDLWPDTATTRSEAAGMKIAVMLNYSGYHVYKPAASGSGQGGSTSVSVYRCGVQSTGLNTYGLGTCYFAGSSAGGTNEFRLTAPAKVTTVNVTGF